MIIIGIDTGSKGAIAFFDTDTNTLLDVMDMPIDRVQSGKHVRSRVARGALLDVLHRARGAVVFIERPEGHPMRQTNKATGQTELRQVGAAGMLAFGESYGCAIMGCTAAGMSITEVRPGQWKRAIGLGAAKDDVRRRCSELFPTHAAKFSRKMDDGRADAAALAYYGARVMGRSSV